MILEDPGTCMLGIQDLGSFVILARVCGNFEHKRSVSEVIRETEHEYGTTKGVSVQSFEIRYVGESPLKGLHSAFHLSFA